MTTTDAAAARQRPLRADARRNYERLLTAAAGAFAEQGPGACLEDIARCAGVGIGTLYRHFPTRQALLEGVYRDRIEALTAEAEALRDAPDPGDALAAWLRSVLAHNLAQRGLKEALLSEGGTELAAACKAELHDAGAVLVARAEAAGAVRPGLEIGDLLRLVYGIALATERAPDGRSQADRLLAIMLDGLRR
ncbi:MAG TPA: helix-turn-helix domain-containing protein [Thermomicrobiales bacterium]|nr:helix-turn-helix domain-containing protein [Thermomicrobiales bacterium]